MELQEIRPGLYRWTARHPEWKPGAAVDSPGDWPPDVGCLAYEAADALVLIDPLVPEAAERFYDSLDGLVRRHGRRVAILTTIPWHRRSRAELAERYGASMSRARGMLPQGVDALPIRCAGETMFWLEEHRALVPGDRILGFGAPDGGLRVCPDSWLRYLRSGLTGQELRAELRKLLELPIELVLVSHGEPVLEHGRAPLARAL